MMLRNIIDLLKSDDWYGHSDVIDTAKGKYQTPTNLKSFVNYFKRRSNG